MSLRANQTWFKSTLGMLCCAAILVQLTVAGGVGNRSSVEIYDPESDTWTQVADMLETRFFHISTVLADGTVLIAGGNGKEALLSGTELFAP